MIRKNAKDPVWLIDIGELDKVRQYLHEGQLISGLFITHPHYDHIYCINDLIHQFPDCRIYCSELCKAGLKSSKSNLSYYHGIPIECHSENIEVLQEGSKVKLFEGIHLEAIETPGHDWSCLTYVISNYIFTGDSYIPNTDVVTKLRGGDKQANTESLKKIFDRFKKDTIICPGHLSMVAAPDYT